MIDIPPLDLWPNGWAATSMAGRILSPSLLATASIFTVPKTGNITHLVFSTGAVSGAQPLSIGLRTVASRAPASTNYGGSAAGSVASPLANTVYEVALATPAAAVAGEAVAGAIGWAGTAGTSVRIDYFNPVIGTTAPYMVEWNGSAWTAVGGVGHCFGLKYSDGSYALTGLPPLSAVTASSYSSTHPSAECALRIRRPYAARLSDVAMPLATLTNTSSDFDLIVYDDNDNVIATQTVFASQNVGVGGNGMRIPVKGAPTLAADTWYRISVKMLSSNSISLRYITFMNSGLMAISPGGADAYLSERPAGGSWTDTPLSRPFILPVIDGVEMGGGTTARRSLFGSTLFGGTQ